MSKKRKIIEIDEDKCNGCGQCILSCAEGALELIDGKAKLVGDILCDGIGACIGECPEDALRIVEREAEEFDEETAKKHVLEQNKAKAATTAGSFQCPYSAAQTLEPAEGENVDGPGKLYSALGHWPIKLQLLGPRAPFLENADLLLLADCAAAAYPELHTKLLRGRAVALACPKLDDNQAHIDRLVELLKGANLKSLTVVIMEVPCCHGLLYAAQQAISISGVSIKLDCIVIGREGEIISEETVSK